MSDRTAIIPFPQTPDAVLTEHIGTGMECVVVAGVDSDGNITSVASTGVTYPRDDRHPASLYRPAYRAYREGNLTMSETYFIGCTHFGRSNIIRLGSRPFKDVNHMNESLVSNWNRVVQPDDRVFHLGDFGWHGSVNFRLRLNGQITYLRGNHDPEGWGPDMIDTRIYGRRVVMCHYPIDGMERILQRRDLHSRPYPQTDPRDGGAACECLCRSHRLHPHLVHATAALSGAGWRRACVMLDLSSGVTIAHGDCLHVLRRMADDSIDSIVADPPYGLAFMGKKWDYDMPGVEIWAECLRVLKPGGYLLAFAGTRTQHRMAVRIEDAGFEIRDMIAWVYGSGFPKSHDVSKAIDKMSGEKGAVIPIGAAVKRLIPGADQHKTGSWIKDNGRTYQPGEYQPATDDAAAWQGWGTALKPALEPITVARKPLIGTVAQNVLTHGTGALNIDGCRVAVDPEADASQLRVMGAGAARRGYKRPDVGSE